MKIIEKDFSNPQAKKGDFIKSNISKSYYRVILDNSSGLFKLVSLEEGTVGVSGHHEIEELLNGRFDDYTIIPHEQVTLVIGGD